MFRPSVKHPILLSFLLFACSADDVQNDELIPGEVTDTGEENEPSTGNAEEPNQPAFCPVAQTDATRDRFVVVSRPYGPGSVRTPDYEVWSLNQDEELAPTETKFSMGRTFKGEIAFREDGSIGAVAHDDGTLGVFKMFDNGSVEVKYPNYQGEFYAKRVSFDPNHPDRLIVLDGRWADYGGGLYEVMFDCEGNIVSETKLASSKLASDFTWLENNQLLLSATTALDSGEPQDLHVLDWQPPNVSRIASAFQFDGDLVIKSFVAFTSNRKHLLVAENSGLTSRAHRIAVYEWNNGSMQFVQLIESINDPSDVLMSPFDNSALVVSGFGDAVYRLEYDENSNTPFGNPVEVSNPAIPGDGVMIRRGDSNGLVLISENIGIKLLKFNETGVADLGAITRSGIENIIGAIGVQP